MYLVKYVYKIFLTFWGNVRYGVRQKYGTVRVRQNFKSTVRQKPRTVVHYIWPLETSEFFKWEFWRRRQQVQLKIGQTYYTHGWVQCVFAVLFDPLVLVRAVAVAGSWPCALVLRRENLTGQTAPRIRIVPTHKYNKFGSFWVELVGVSVRIST